MIIKQFMTSPVVSVEMDDSLLVVKEIFDNTEFHHLLVVANGKLQGVISDRDFLKAVSPHLDTAAETVADLSTLSKKAHQIMSRKPICLGPEDNIANAIELFQNNLISCIPIVNNKQVPVGIVSWRDIIRRINTQKHNLHNK